MIILIGGIIIKKIDISDVIWNYIGTIFSMGLGFFMLPILLKFLSADMLGIWYVMVSLSNIATLFTFGFTPAFSRNVNYCWNGARRLSKVGKDEETITDDNQVDYHLLNVVMKSCKLVYLFIAILASVLIGIIGNFHLINISGDIFNHNIEISWIIMVLAIYLNIYYAYYSSFLVGIGMVKESNKILVMSGCIRLLVMFVLMKYGLGILGATLAYLVWGIVFRCCSKYVFYHSKCMKEAVHVFKRNKIEIKEVFHCIDTIWYNAWRDGMVSLSDYLQTQASTLVCSLFLSLSDTAAFSLTTQLITSLGKGARSIDNAYAPEYQGAYIKGDIIRLKETKALCLTAFSIVYWIGIVAILLVGIPILQVIKPEVLLSISFILIYGLYQFILTYRNIFGAYLSATNRVIYWKAYVLTGVGSIALYTVILNYFGGGIWTIVFTSIVCELSYNFWKWQSIVNRELGLEYPSLFTLGIKMIKDKLLQNGVRNNNG